MKDKKVAVRYAEAALAAAKDAKEMESLKKDIESFARLVEENTNLRHLFSHPGIPLDKKRNIVGAAVKKLGLSQKAGKVLEVINRRGRMDVISEIAESYAAKLDEHLGRQRVQVTTAYALSPADSQGLEKAFSAITGKKAWLDLKMDKSLIGGLVASVGGKVYDGSVSNQLKAMKIKLEQEA